MSSVLFELLNSPPAEIAGRAPEWTGFSEAYA